MKMRESADTIASWASILGSLVAFFGLIQSQTWLVGVGFCFLGISTVAVFHAWRTRQFLQSASISVEGLNLDSLNIANLRRRSNHSLVLQRAYQLARIEGRDLSVAWQYEGFCQAARETSIEFSIDTENNCKRPTNPRQD